VAQLGRFIDREVPAGVPLVVAGDFNDWGAKLQAPMAALGLADCGAQMGRRPLTFPARLPLTQLDFVYSRGLHVVEVTVPHGPVWRRMSDHLPLIADLRF
jgi:endonuclease/exonuclease/phosphatase family metal-dependent hydrolase